MSATTFIIIAILIFIIGYYMVKKRMIDLDFKTVKRKLDEFASMAKDMANKTFFSKNKAGDDEPNEDDDNNQDPRKRARTHGTLPDDKLFNKLWHNNAFRQIKTDELKSNLRDLEEYKEDYENYISSNKTSNTDNRRVDQVDTLIESINAELQNRIKPSQHHKVETQDSIPKAPSINDKFNVPAVSAPSQHHKVETQDSMINDKFNAPAVSAPSPPKQQPITPIKYTTELPPPPPPAPPTVIKPIPKPVEQPKPNTAEKERNNYTIEPVPAPAAIPISKPVEQPAQPQKPTSPIKNDVPSPKPATPASHSNNYPPDYPPKPPTLPPPAVVDIPSAKNKVEDVEKIDQLREKDNSREEQTAHSKPKEPSIPTGPLPHPSTVNDRLSLDRIPLPKPNLLIAEKNKMELDKIKTFQLSFPTWNTNPTTTTKLMDMMTKALEYVDSANEIETTIANFVYMINNQMGTKPNLLQKIPWGTNWYPFSIEMTSFLAKVIVTYRNNKELQKSCAKLILRIIKDPAFTFNRRRGGPYTVFMGYPWILAHYILNTAEEQLRSEVYKDVIKLAGIENVTSYSDYGLHPDFTYISSSKGDACCYYELINLYKLSKDLYKFDKDIKQPTCWETFTKIFKHGTINTLAFGLISRHSYSFNFDYSPLNGDPPIPIQYGIEIIPGCRFLRYFTESNVFFVRGITDYLAYYELDDKTSLKPQYCTDLRHQIVRGQDLDKLMTGFVLPMDVEQPLSMPKSEPNKISRFISTGAKSVVFKHDKYGFLYQKCIISEYGDYSREEFIVADENKGMVMCYIKLTARDDKTYKLIYNSLGHYAPFSKDIGPLDYMIRFGMRGSGGTGYASTPFPNTLQYNTSYSTYRIEEYMGPKPNENISWILYRNDKPTVAFSDKNTNESADLKINGHVFKFDRIQRQYFIMG